MTKKKISSGLNDIVKQIKDQKSPPVHLWNPEFCGDLDMRIGRDGTWYYLGSPIGRKPLVKLFSSVIRKDGDDYFLVTPVEKIGITVDDAPFTAVEMFTEGQGKDQVISFRTQVDDYVIVDADHPFHIHIDPETDEPAPYIRVRRNLEALIVRAVFYDLVELSAEEARDGENLFGFWSSGVFFELGRMNDIFTE